MDNNMSEGAFYIEKCFIFVINKLKNIICGS